MPADYLAMKKKFIADGLSVKDAEAKAARIHNAKHPTHPVGPHSDFTTKSIVDAVSAGTPLVPPAGSVTAFAGAPKELVDLYAQEYGDQRENGASHDEAHRRAIRMTQHAGWHRTSKGWRQLHADVRDKINVRDAVKQPNGRFIIEDVDVFYPNAAKGEPYNDEDIRQISANTNRMIESGSQKPGLLEIHPNDYQKAIGVQLPSYGSGVNWREHPEKTGWARCDLIDIDPAIIEKMRTRQLTGLSAGIAKDGGGLNRRFGHVAMLGGETQALSQLPITELADVYSVSSQVCFSATPPADTSFLKGQIMNDKHKACYGALADAYSACAAAFTSFNAGEPGSDKKVEESKAKLDAAFAAACELGEEGNPLHHILHHKHDVESSPAGGFAAPPDAMPVPGTPTPPAATAAPIVDNAPPTPVGSLEQPRTGVSFAADPEAAFNALSEENAAQRKTIADLVAVTNGLIGNGLKQQFSVQIDALRRDGHQLPDQPDIEQMFSVCASGAKPKDAIEKLLNMLRKLPKRQSVAAVGQVFDASAAQPAAQKPDNGAAAPNDLAAQMRRISDNLGTMNFSADDLKLGALVSAEMSRLGQ
jgi:ribosomal protein S16